MSFLRARPGAVAATIVALPMGYYFLRSSPVTGSSPSARPAEATLHTPESRGAVIPQRQTNTEDQANERSQLLGNETGAGNFRVVDPTAKVQRGKKDSAGNPLNEVDQSDYGGQWRSSGAKHSIAIDKDPSKSKKSTGEPETARATGTIIPGGGKK